jgi:hypothetical protein
MKAQNAASRMRSRSGASDGGIGLLLGLLFFTEPSPIRCLAAAVLNRTLQPAISPQTTTTLLMNGQPPHKSKPLKHR